MTGPPYAELDDLQGMQVLVPTHVCGGGNGDAQVLAL
jgi:hypothetical protein